MSHKQLTTKQCVELATLLRAGMKQNRIAGLINTNPSTISREINRNCDEDGIYRASSAKMKRAKRRKSANQRFHKIKANPWTRSFILQKLRLFWSPEQISGYLKNNFPDQYVCHETIYNYIQTHHKLIKYLRCQRGQYKRKYGSRIKDKLREEEKKKRIDTRPKIVDQRSRIGDFEGDTIVGNNKKDKIYTLVDRKSGFLFAKIIKANGNIAESIWKLTVDIFKTLPDHAKNTITFDNGSEFARHDLIERDTNIEVFFAYPYHSWERATNENTNGLLRQFFPKGSSFANITQEYLDQYVKLINRRPRKRLNYLTPFQVFRKNCNLN